jgi:hypothetical protein
MSLFRKLEEKTWLGEVVHDYGVISESRRGITRTRISVLLCKHDGNPYLVIKESGFAVVAASVHYTYVPLDALGRFKDAVNDAYNRALGGVVV